MRLQIMGAFCALSLAVGGSASAANLMYGTATGVLASGSTDAAGLFGAGFEPGQAIELSITYDPHIAGSDGYFYPGLRHERYSGTSRYGPTGLSQIISASITINGISQDMSPLTYDSYVIQTSAGGFRLGGAQSSQVSDLFSLYISEGGSFGTQFGDLRGGYSYMPVAPCIDCGYFRLTGAPGGAIQTEGRFHIERIRVAQAVPEPATWSLLIGGFGLAGAALRRRRAEFATA